MRQALVLFGLMTVAGCNQSHSAQDDSAVRYSVATSYVLEYRRHFYPGQAERVCFATDGWPVEGVVREFRSYHLPVVVGCEAAKPRGDDSTRGLTIWLGPGPKGTWKEEETGIPDWPSRAAMAEVDYLDSGGRQGVFSCLLFQADTGWQVQGCSLLSAGRLTEEGPSSLDLARCWLLEWNPYTGPAAIIPPRTMLFTLRPDTTSLARGALQVTTPSGLPLGQDWGLGWSWTNDGSHLVELHSGGGFEGISGQLVWDSDDNTLRGVGVHWTDVREQPELPDPEWQVTGVGQSCEVSAAAI